MTENQSFSFADSIREARQRLELELHAQAEQIQKLNLEVAELQSRHERTEQEASRQWDEVTRVAELAAEASAAVEPPVSPDTVLENVLGAVRALMTCTDPDQVFETLTEEASEWGVRAAIFDVRGRAAWGASAHGFGPALSGKVFQSLIVQLNQDNPFRQVCETAGPVDASPATLKKNRNVLDKLKPAPHAPILLLPVRSAGTVSAIFYADPGGEGQPIPVNALKILAEFAGAQIDRLIALSGGVSEEEVKEETMEAAENESPVEEAPVEAPAEDAAQWHPQTEEHVVEAPAAEAPPSETHVEPAAEEPPVAEAEPSAPPVEVAEEAPVEAPPAAEVIAETPAPPPEVVVEAPVAVAAVEESAPAPPIVEQPVEVIPPPPPPVTVVESTPPPAPAIPAAPAAFDVSQLSEADQKVHKDAKRFARLLVSEIELYNKAKVADGRKNRDLYKRLKSDIDRSRQTFQKRFGKVLSKQVDYFHDELVKSLAANDSAILGPEYPGPSA